MRFLRNLILIVNLYSFFNYYLRVYMLSQIILELKILRVIFLYL